MATHGALWPRRYSGAINHAQIANYFDCRAYFGRWVLRQCRDVAPGRNLEAAKHSCASATAHGRDFGQSPAAPRLRQLLAVRVHQAPLRELSRHSPRQQFRQGTRKIRAKRSQRKNWTAF